MSAKIVHMSSRARPRNFTSAEAVLDEIRERIHMDGRTQTRIAMATGVSQSTIHNIATGQTKWPRHTTLFPLIAALGMRLEIIAPDGRHRDAPPLRGKP